MRIKVCPNGHHYNADDNDKCPYCEKANSNNSYDWSDGLSESTAPIGGWDTRTQADNDWNVRNDQAGGGGSDKTQVIGAPISGNRNNFTPDEDNKTRAMGDFKWGDDTGEPADQGHTQAAWSKDEYQHQPVVGWLVCIEGPDKGRDFSLHGAKSSIGRRKESAVCLSDPKISRTGFPALIVYDDRKTHRFYLTSGDASSQNNVELAGNMLLGQSVIEPYTEIRIEDTVLVFVPFCGDDFYWKES